MALTRNILEPAPLWNRWVARAIDLMIAGAPGALLQWVGSPNDAPGTLAQVSVGWFFLYALFADAMGRGQSVGKRLAGLRTVNAATDEPCGYGQSIIRNLVLLVLGPIDLLIGGADEGRRRLGDRMAGTAVVEAD